ncbi:hypothetical protein RQM59_00125 [Flavobacteriaceae bacterium S356]|uniref:Trimeric autotransporter adhesin YadA-like head domain-containing protein n=1 Tax=Asprobacillus argus TaxID=3076534 RepID=A0ABU3LBV0_9FLAO|nr:hypothetical protein [Flavobacteriaceae bacterium S356]
MKIKLLVVSTFMCLSFTAYTQTGNFVTLSTPSSHRGILANLSSGGNYNLGLGDNALFSLTSSDYNIAIGHSSGFSITSGGHYNTLMGYQTGYFNISGDDNTFLGFRSGYFNTTNDNTFVGKGSGFNNTTGFDNVFIGEESGVRNTTGSDNVYIGEDTGGYAPVSPNTVATTNPATGSFNTAVGNNALYNITSGYNNTTLGYRAGHDITTGNRNTFVGDNAGADISKGILNTFIGQETGRHSEFTSYNTFVGASAGWDNNRDNEDNTTNARDNTYLGYSAGYLNRLGSYNVMLGSRADFTVTSTNFYNIAIGYDVRLDDPGSGSSSRAIIIGANGSAATDGISIGYDADNFGLRSIGIGTNVDISSGETDLVAIGYDANPSGAYATLIGTRASSTDLYATVVGYESAADSLSTALGARTTVTGKYSSAIGAGATTAQNNTMVLGGLTTQDRVTVAVGTATPNIKASIDLADTDRGFLLNRLTTAQRTALGATLSTTDKGMMVYDTDTNALNIWSGTAWKSIEDRITALENASSGSGTDVTPQKFNYQTSIVDTNGEPVMNQSVNFRISILETSVSGTTVYSETHSITTTGKGLTHFQIGSGTVVSGDFNTIGWSSKTHYLKVEADITGGTSYTDFGTSQLISVPYAIHAKTADKLTGGINSSRSAREFEAKTAEIEKLKKEVAQLKAMILEIQKKVQK